MLVRMRTGSFLGRETRRSKVIREQHSHCVSDSFPRIFVWIARVHTLPAPFFFCGFCEDATEGRNSRDAPPFFFYLVKLTGPFVSRDIHTSLYTLWRIILLWVSMQQQTVCCVVCGVCVCVCVCVCAMFCWIPGPCL